MVAIEVLDGPVCTIGENPLWDPQDQRLYWMDAPGRAIFRATADGRELTRWEAPTPMGSMVLRRDGGAVVALQKSIQFLDFRSGRFEPIVETEPGQPALHLNDGKVDAQGRFVVGSFDSESYDPAKPGVALSTRGTLYRLDTDLSLHAIEGGIACTNGPCFSPDGSRFYLADTMIGTIWAYDWNAAAGTLSNKRRFLLCPPESGMPDGATVDAEGFFWCAFMGSGELRRYAPDGSFDRAVRLPVLKVTSLTFGGPEHDILYVTSAGAAFPPEDGPLGGRTFAVRGLGIRGVADPRFAG